VEAPRLLVQVAPEYPESAVPLHVQGVVGLEAYVATDGSVERVEVVRALHPLLDQAAADAVRQWRYSPLVLDGVPRRFAVTLRVRFEQR
jgi:protein TonB